MLGRTQEEICAVGREGVIDLADPRLHAAIAERARTGRFAGELTHKRKDGTRFPAEVATSIFKDRDGRERACVIIRDITDRKRAEEVFRKSQEQYRMLLEASRDAVTVNVGTTMAYANKRFAELLGFSDPSELVGRDSVDFVAPEGREFVRDRTFRRERGENMPALYEFIMLRKDGVRVPVEVNAVAIEWEGRRATLSFRRDITERKQMEAEIRDMARFPAENPNPVLRLDRHGTVVSANESSKKLLQSWSSRIGQVAPKYWCDLVTEVLHTGQSRDIDVELNERSYTFLAKPIIEAGYVNLYGRDITERKRLEEELKKHSEHLEELVKDRTRVLRESEEKYRVLVLTSPDAVAVTDLNGTITDVSDRTLGLLGFSSAEELLGRNSLDLIAPEHREKAMNDIQRTMNGTVLRNAEYVLLRKDGTLIPAELNATMIKDGEGKPKTFIVSMRDTSERRRLEQMREQFLSHVTHELRTPLGPLKVHVEYALAGKLGPLSEKLKSSLQVMKMDTDRLMELTDQLLDIRRFQSGNFQLNLQPLDLREIINQSIKEAQVALDVKKQYLHVEVPDRSLPLSGDAIRLSQVMTNLLSNASKFTPENGQITLKLEDITEAFKVTVSDTGIGIRKEDLATVFLPFVAIQKPTWMKGVGLGLSITKGIVEAHGGKIWVESEGEGKGATFTFTLPKLTRVLQT
jgi:PAS domain S-box-containing protein